MKPSRVLVLVISIAALIAAPTVTQPAAAASAPCPCCQTGDHGWRADGAACDHPCTSCECEGCAYPVSTQAAARLNSLQVRFFVLRGELDDHRALSGHFEALANDFRTEAGRQVRFARAFAGNPNRFTVVPAGGANAARRAVAQREAEAVAAQLAAHHASLAVGLPSSAPAGAAAYWAGTGARAPTREEVKDVERLARLPREHRDLAEYFTATAQEQLAVAAAHDAHIAGYRGTRIAQAADHCERLATAARREATWATGRSVMHAQLAALAR